MQASNIRSGFSPLTMKTSTPSDATSAPRFAFRAIPPVTSISVLWTPLKLILGDHSVIKSSSVASSGGFISIPSTPLIAKTNLETLAMSSQILTTMSSPDSMPNSFSSQSTTSPNVIITSSSACKVLRDFPVKGTTSVFCPLVRG